MGEKKRICLGALAGAHGVRGEVKVKSFTEDPENVAAYGSLQSEDGNRSFTLTLVRETKPALFVARAPEITSREEAEELKGTRLYVDRDRLPPPGEDEFYHEDLIGLAARDPGGGPVGRVKAVHNFGAGDILEIQPATGKTLLVPFTQEAVPVLNFDQGWLRVVMPEEGEDPVAPSDTLQ